MATERHRQIADGQDISFEHVVVPAAITLLGKANLDCVLDVGSGTGDFTCRLAEIAGTVIGVEPSQGSVAIANKYCLRSNVTFIKSTLEDFTLTPKAANITTAVANMTLMTASSLKTFANAVDSVLTCGSNFIATLTHPCFWPRYWGYDTEPWFDYSKELFIEAPFTISNCQTKFLTTHIHRPLEQYLGAFERHDFELCDFLEPIPSVDVQHLYPTNWKYPRFIAARWIKRGK